MKRLLLALTLLAGASSVASAQPLAVAQAGPLGLSGTTCVPGASTTATSCLLLNVTGLGTASVSISGTYSGTITFTGSNGGPYVNVGCTSTAAGSAAANTTTGTGTFICPVAGLRILEANITSYSSGTAVAWMLGAPGGGAAGGGASGSVTQGTSPWVVTGNGAAGAPDAAVLTVQGASSMTPIATTAAQSGAYTVGQSGSPWGVLGTLSNNNAATGSNLLDAMVGTVGASAPSYTDGRSVKWRMDTGGAGYVNVNNPSPVDANSYPLVSPGATATSTGSATPCYVQSGTGTLADTSNHANCKASAGNFYGFRAVNTSATLAYLRMYNLTTDPTCTSATGFIESIPIPASATGAGITDHVGPPIPYATGIGYCITATGANTNNGAPPVGVFVTLFTK